MTSLLQFLRELKKERTRIVLTVFAIVWGTASIVLMLAIGDGVTRGLKKGMYGMGKGIVVVWGGETSKPYKGLGIGRAIRLRETDATLLRERVQGIDLISPEYTNWGVYLSAGKRSVTTRVVGVWPEYGPLRNIYPQRGGRFLNPLDLQLRRRVIFLGNDVKEQLFGEEDFEWSLLRSQSGVSPSEKGIGEVVYLNGVPFTVIGAMKEKIQTSAYQGMDKDGTYIPASTFGVMFGHRYLNDMVYRPKDISTAEQVKNRIYQVMAEQYQFDPEDKEPLSMWDTIEVEQIFGKVALGVRMFLGIIGGLTLLVAGVGLANIMYAVIRGRTREIGIKMAVGAKPGNIIIEYILQSLVTVFAGGIIGLGFSWLLVWIVNILPLQQELFQYLGKPVMSVTTAIITSAVLGLIGLMAGIFPARRAASIDPAEALRYE